MNISVSLSDDGVHAEARDLHPLEQADAGRLLADLVLRLHHELTHCGDADTQV